VSILQIDVQGVDADGNTAIATVEVDVTEPPATGTGDVMITPPPVKTAISMEAAGSAHVTAEAAPPDRVDGGAKMAEARLLGEQQPKQIPGLGNGVLNNHQGATVVTPAPKVTQAVRSVTLFRNTGGFR
jgi:hypothetical protein